MLRELKQLHGKQMYEKQLHGKQLYEAIRAISGVRRRISDSYSLDDWD